ncbi:hypothetical protein [uncultured Methylobacterium sp.]|uniref:hypothetical protein n=1 Tax=uncultured Methylobacterium sp. TaxID=157278 RepID=UPI0035CC7050
MPDRKISVLDAPGTLTGNEKLPGVQGGANVSLSLSQVRDYILAGVPVLADLPSTNPGVVGKFWNNNGVLSISSGGAPTVGPITYGAEYVPTQNLADAGQFFTGRGMVVGGTDTLTAPASVNPAGPAYGIYSLILPSKVFFLDFDVECVTPGAFNAVFNGSGTEIAVAVSGMIAGQKRHYQIAFDHRAGGPEHVWGFTFPGTAGSYKPTNIKFREYVSGALPAFNTAVVTNDTPPAAVTPPTSWAAEFVAPGGPANYTAVPANATNPFNIGVFSAYSGGRTAAFNTWFGRQVDEGEIHIGRGAWSELESGSGDQLFNQLQASDAKTITFCPPLFPVGSNFAEVTGGTHDNEIRAGVRNMLNSVRPSGGKWPSARAIIRIGQEMNIPGYQPWRITNDSTGEIDETKAKASAAARRHWAKLVRQVETELGLANGFTLFDLCMSFRCKVNHADWWYPGDQFTDIISVDTYQNSEYGDPATGPESFVYHRDDPRGGWAWCADFANNASSRPPITYVDAGGVTRTDTPSGKLLWGIPELGLKAEADSAAFAGPYLTGLRNFIVANGGAFIRYWDDPGDYSSQISNGALPNIGAAFKAAFNRATAGAPAYVSKYTGPTVPAYVPPAGGTNLLVAPSDFNNAAWYTENGASKPAANRMAFSAGQVGEFGQKADAGFGAQGASVTYTSTLTLKLISGTPGPLEIFWFDNFGDNQQPLGTEAVQVGQSITVTKTYNSSGSGGGRNWSIRNTGQQPCVWEHTVAPSVT